MSFTTQSSTAIGWANFLWDYLGGYAHIGSAIDGHLRSAIADAINGTNGAVPGGTIYFPPLTGGHNYILTGTITVSGACSLVSMGPQDMTLSFTPPGLLTTGSAFVITGPNVTMQGFTVDYAGGSVSPGSDNVAAIQVINTSGVLLRNLDITNAFGGVDCIGSSMECEWMHIRKIQDPGVSPQMAFGFRAQPGSLTGSSLDGLVMKLRRCEPHLPATGAAGFILASPYPEMAIQDSPASNGEFGFYVQAPTGSPTGNLGILRIRNSTAENDTYGLYADGGSVVQSSALMSDECKTASIFLTSNFSGVASLAGDHYVSLGPNAVAGLAIGTTGSASSAMVGLIGSTIGTDDSSPPTGIAGIFAALTSGGSLVANASAGHKLNRTVEVGASGAGSVSLVGVAAGATPNPLQVDMGVSGTVLMEGSPAAPADNVPSLPASGAIVGIHNSPSLTPAGFVHVAFPPLTATGGSQTNWSGFDALVYLQDRSGGTSSLSGVTVGGINTGVESLGVNAMFPIMLPAGVTIGLTYLPAPTGIITGAPLAWTWMLQ